MKKQKFIPTLRFYLGLCFLILVSGCGDNNSDDPVPAGETLLLKSYTVDEVEHMLYYDDEQNLQAIGVAGGGHAVELSGTSLVRLGDLQFDLSELPERSEFVTSVGHGMVYYDQDGKMISLEYNCSLDNTLANEHDVSYDFSYDGSGRLTEAESYYYGGFEGSEAENYNRYIMSYDGNGNVTAISREESADDVTYTERERFTITYDNKRNPWHTILKEKLLLNEWHLDPAHVLSNGLVGFVPVSFVGKNNVTKITSQIASITFSTEYSYTYNSEGYPVSGEMVVKGPFGEQRESLAWSYLESEE